MLFATKTLMNVAACRQCGSVCAGQAIAGVMGGSVFQDGRMGVSE